MPARGEPVREFQAGTVAGKTLALWFLHFVPFTVLSALLHLPWTLARFYGFAPGRARGVAATVLIHLAVILLLAGAVTYAVVRAMDRRPVPLAECLRRALATVPSAAGVSLVALLGIWIGLHLLVVPGVIFLCGWWVALPVAVAERPGVFASLGRSLDLTAGRLLRILKLFLILLLLSMPFTIVVELLHDGLASSPLALEMVRLAAFAVIAPLLPIAMAVSYHDLRSEKEGADTNELAALFD